MDGNAFETITEVLREKFPKPKECKKIMEEFGQKKVVFRKDGIRITIEKIE